jgi:hypothetical protein
MHCIRLIALGSVDPKQAQPVMTPVVSSDAAGVATIDGQYFGRKPLSPRRERRKLKEDDEANRDSCTHASLASAWSDPFESLDEEQAIRHAMSPTENRWDGRYRGKGRLQ